MLITRNYYKWYLSFTIGIYIFTKNLTKLGEQLEDMQFSTMVVYIIH